MRVRFCGAVILLMLTALLIPVVSSAVADSGDYFGAVNNESLLPFTRRYMPVMVGGKLMIPHFLLTDTEIGARIEWSERQHYLTLTCSGKSVTFELGPNIAFDVNNTIYDAGMLRNEYSGVVYNYLELSFVCDYFGWNYSSYPTDYGRILRIKTKDGLRTDAQYAAQEWDRLLEQYYELYPSAVESAPPAVSKPPAVSTPPVRPSPTPEPPVVEPPVGVYITFDGALNEYTEELLTVLEDYGVRAAFFLTEEGLDSRPALLRRLTATQVVGLCGPNSATTSPEPYMEQAERMNDMLDRITFTKTRLTRWPGLYALSSAGPEDASEPVRDALVQGGYRLWDWTLSASTWPQLTPEALSEKLISSLPSASDGPAVLRFGMNEHTVQTLPLLLESLSDRDRFHLRSIGITDRPINRSGDPR